jgi:Ca-activated chloride channel family protein
MKKKANTCVPLFIVTTVVLVIAACSSGGGSGSDGGGIAPSINVSMNQIETDCLNPGTEITAFVTVVDQNDNPVLGLIQEKFTITEGPNTLSLDDFEIRYAEQIDIPLSVTIVIEYSLSITSKPDTVNAMEDAALAFIDELADIDGDSILDKDEVEIIKFASIIEVVTSGFTSDKVELTSAITDFLDVGNETYLYDALIKAVNDTSPAPDRRAVIVLTDGINDLSPANTTANDVIILAQANGVPIFTIGLGQNIDADVLSQIADNTGGVFYNPATAENLKQVYLQLADALIINQYIITIYESSIAAATTSDLLVEVDHNGLWDSDQKQFTSCP